MLKLHSLSSPATAQNPHKSPSQLLSSHLSSRGRVFSTNTSGFAPSPSSSTKRLSLKCRQPEYFDQQRTSTAASPNKPSPASQTPAGGYTGTILLKNGKLSELLGELQSLLNGSGEHANGDYDSLAAQISRMTAEIRQIGSSRGGGTVFVNGNGSQIGNMTSLIIQGKGSSYCRAQSSRVHPFRFRGIQTFPGRFCATSVCSSSRCSCI